MPSLVSADWLAAQLSDGDLRVADVRWYLDPARKGLDAYRAGHIPGAVFLDVETELSAPGGRRGGPLGRHPWPSAEQVSQVMSRAGIGPGTFVVAYDDQAGAVAARLWFLLRAYGHDRVAVLDGGLPAWTAGGYPTTTQVVAPAAAAFEARLRPGWVVSKEEMVAKHAGELVLDVRLEERYRGEREPIDPRAGHVPGAKSAPFSGNLSGGSLPVFLSADALRRRYAALGAEAKEPIVYCGSGLTACHALLALDVAGLKGRLYAGSWSEWSSDPALPVETGGE